METRQIEVSNDDCILMMDSKGNFKMMVPTPDNPEEEIPLAIVFMTAVGLMIAKDDELFQFVMERFDEILETYVNSVAVTADINNVVEFFSKNVEKLRSR